MDFDLGSRGKKLQREQEVRREAARRKQEREKVLQEKVNQLRAEMEIVAQRRKAEQLRLAQEEEERKLEEERVTGGISYKKMLRAVPIANDGDKITLPVSALEELNPQNAFDSGVFTFELTYNGAKTHASVLEFIADENTIGIPPKIARSLRLAQADANISIRFVRLSKGQRVKLQPCGEGFGDRQIDLKQLLERTLHTHTTLTEGDILLVRHGKITFEVQVKEVFPDPQVTILNVDLEVDLVPSEAVEQKKAEELAAVERKLREEENLRRLEQERIQRQTEAASRLPSEPSQNEGLKLMIRTPEAGQHTRRFLFTDSVSQLYDFIVSITGYPLGTFCATANYPRRIIEYSDIQLKDAGIVGRQEALFIERIAAPDTAIEDVEMESNDVIEDIRIDEAWQTALESWEHKQDEALYTPDIIPVHGLEPSLPTASEGDKWGAQLNELENMGFFNRELNIQILEKYRGRLLRVVNYLSELPVVDG